MIRIAIVGTGGMANIHADNYKKIKGCQLVAGCDVSAERAKAFCEKHGIPKAYTDLDEMLEKEKIDAVSNVTPDRFHAATSLKIIAHGKHILCEKPLAENYADACKMTQAAKKQGVINMVNFSYRNSSAIHKAAQLIQEGKLGSIVHVEASYLQSWLSSKVWGDWRTTDAWLWRLSSKHGSKGVLGDVGVHILDFSTYPIGPLKKVGCVLKTFPKAPKNRVGKYVLDANDSAILTVEFANGAIGTIHTTRWATGYKNTVALRIHGEHGALRINLDESYTDLNVCLGKDVDKAEWKTIKCPATPTMYQRFIRSIKTGKNDQPDFARGAEIQKILDTSFVSDRKGTAIKL